MRQSIHDEVHKLIVMIDEGLALAIAMDFITAEVGIIADAACLVLKTALGAVRRPDDVRLGRMGEAVDWSWLRTTIPIRGDAVAMDVADPLDVRISWNQLDLGLD